LYTYQKLREIRKEILSANTDQGKGKTKKVSSSLGGSRSSAPVPIGTEQGGVAGLIRPSKGKGSRVNLRNKVKQARRELKKLLEADKPERDQVLKAYSVFRTKVSNLVSTREKEPDKDTVRESYLELRETVEKLFPGTVGTDKWTAVKSGEAFVTV